MGWRFTGEPGAVALLWCCGWGVGACTRQGTWGKLDRMKWWGRRPQPEPLLSLCSRSWVLAAGDRAGKGHVKTHDGR